MRKGLLLLLLCGSLYGESNPFGLSDKTNETLKESYIALFNEDFETSAKLMASLERSKRDHPAVFLADVVRNWWKMSSRVLETDEEASEPFLTTAEQCISISKRKMDVKSREAESLFALGTTLGLMSRWSVSNRGWIAAYVRGHKAGDFSEQALKINPGLNDAYMTLGTFNFAKDIIRRSMEKEGIEAEQETTAKAWLEGDGINQLKKAYAEGTYFKEGAGLMLAGILTNEDPKQAIPLLLELKEKLPRSAFVHMVYLTALYNAGKIEEMTKETDVFFENIAASTYPASALPQAYFAHGLLALRSQNWKQAVQDFEDAIKDGKETNPYFTWAHLYKGYALDAQGERRKAKEMYETVLTLRRRFASHDHARAHLQKPFRRTDPEMKKVEL